MEEMEGNPKIVAAWREVSLGNRNLAAALATLITIMKLIFREAFRK
jgi:hypothetical protein